MRGTFCAVARHFLCGERWLLYEPKGPFQDEKGIFPTLKKPLKSIPKPPPLATNKNKHDKTSPPHFAKCGEFAKSNVRYDKT